MKSVLETRRVMIYRSEIRPEIQTEDAELGEVIAWADDHPVVYDVVTTRKSKAYGRGALDHIGWAQESMETDAILARLSLARRHALAAYDAPTGSIKPWRARFVIQHFGESGYTGGLLQQYARHIDGKEYRRFCETLDYTPKLLEEVVERFIHWFETSPAAYEHTTRVTLDGKDIRTFDPPVPLGM